LKVESKLEEKEYRKLGFVIFVTEGLEMFVFGTVYCLGEELKNSF